MDPRLPRRPLWQWDPFILVSVLALAVISVLVVRLGIPVISVVVGILTTVLVAILLAGFAWRSIRDSRSANPPGVLTDLSDLRLIPLEPTAYLWLDETARRQSSIDLALTTGTSPFEAVLCPRATRFLGREYRTEAYLIAGDRLLRAGFVPRQRDAVLGPRLAELAATGHYLRVPARIVGAGKAPDPRRPYALLERPFTVEIGISEVSEIDSSTRPDVAERSIPARDDRA